MALKFITCMTQKYHKQTIKTNQRQGENIVMHMADKRLQSKFIKKFYELISMSQNV